MTIYLSDVAKGHDNNFNIIRMLASTGVLISHAYARSSILGLAQKHPIRNKLCGWISNLYNNIIFSSLTSIHNLDCSDLYDIFLGIYGYTFPEKI